MPPRYGDRDCVNNSDWVCDADSFTVDFAEALAAAFAAAHGGRCPWMVINHLHRSKLDANRNVSEATGGDANAEVAWRAFHNFTTRAQEKVAAVHGDDGSAIKGILFDVHGYAGTDWRAAGSP